MEFIDLGEKSTVSQIKPEKVKEIFYPSLHIADKNLPFDENDVGKEITATVRLKIISIERSIRPDGKKIQKKENCNFDVLGINFGKSKIDTEEIIEKELEKEEKK